MAILALVSDLMMQSQLAAASRAAGVPLAVAHSTSDLAAKAADDPPSLVIVDLSSGGVDCQAIVDSVAEHAPHATTVAFGPHVHKPKLDAALAAGFTRVISRGQFHAELDAIVAQGK